MNTRNYISFDWALKKILRNKSNFEILEWFLSELIKKDIKINSILESESNKESRDDKFNRVDLLAEDKNKDLFIIEVQYNRSLDYLKRILYATSKTIVENISEWEWYKEVKRIISINLLYTAVEKWEDYIYKWKTTFTWLTKRDVLNLSDNQKKLYKADKISEVYPEYYMIFINKFDESKETKSTLEEWVYFFKTDNIRTTFSAKGIKKAEKKLKILTLTEEEKREYEQHRKQLMHEESLLQSNYIDWRYVGLEEWMKKMEKKLLRNLMKTEWISEQEARRKLWL